MLVDITTTPGDVLDRESIIQIKLQRISDPVKLQAIERSQEMIRQAVDLIRWRVSDPYLSELEGDLREANAKVWDAEEAIRDPAATTDQLIAAAVAAREGNERRNATKRKIDDYCGAPVTEVKSHAA